MTYRRYQWWQGGLWALILVGVVACGPAPAPAAPTQAPAPAAPKEAPKESAAPKAVEPKATAPAKQAVAPKPATAAPAAKKPTTAAELALYQGADRAQLIEQGARTEGKVTMYTSYIVNQVLRPLVSAFEKKYPFVKVEYTRADGDEILERVKTEYQANRYQVDVIEDSSSPVQLAALGHTQQIYSPLMQAYPKDPDVGVDPNGMWATTVLYPRALAYNTNLVNKNELPTAWEGLLDPKWKGKVAWSDSLSTSQMIMGSWLATMGEAKGTKFIQDFAKQDVKTLGQSTRAVLDQVIAGDYALCICSVHHVEISKSQGAPVDWVSLGDTVPETTAMVSLAKNPPHPHAGMLWIDFMLDPEGGQKVFSDVRYIPAHPKYAAEIAGLKGKKVWVMGEEQLKDAPKWKDLLSKYFLH